MFSVGLNSAIAAPVSYFLTAPSTEHPALAVRVLPAFINLPSLDPGFPEAWPGSHGRTRVPAFTAEYLQAAI